MSIEKIEEAFGRIDTLLTKSVRRLLIVEDDLIQRESIRQLIAGNDIETPPLATGREAFAELSQGGYDCMILDLGLADMSGFELLEKIREVRPAPVVPVIVYTGRELSREEENELRKLHREHHHQGVKSPERLLDESALFLHRVEANLPAEQQRKMLKLDPRQGGGLRRQDGAGGRRRHAQRLRPVQRPGGKGHRRSLSPTTASRRWKRSKQKPGHRPRADGYHDAGDGRL